MENLAASPSSYVPANAMTGDGAFGITNSGDIVGAMAFGYMPKRGTAYYEGYLGGGYVSTVALNSNSEDDAFLYTANGGPGMVGGELYDLNNFIADGRKGAPGSRPWQWSTARSVSSATGTTTGKYMGSF